MGSNQHRSRRNERNGSNIEEKREKDRKTKKKRRTILRGEEVSNQAMMEESNAIDTISIILNLCNFIFIYLYNFHYHNLMQFI